MREGRSEGQRQREVRVEYEAVKKDDNREERVVIQTAMCEE